MSEKLTVSSGNVFEDVGIAPDEAAAMLVRETLLIALEKELRKRGKKQQALADELGVPRTRISELMHQRTDRFRAPTAPWSREKSMGWRSVSCELPRTPERGR